MCSALLSKMTSIYKRRVNAPLRDYIYYVFNMQRVGGKKMKSDEAVLLPTLHKEFCHKLLSNLELFVCKL